MTRKLVSVVLGILILSSVAMAQDNAKISLLISDLDRNESHFMLGLDMIVIGSMSRDAALGYPRSAVGMSPLLGVTWRQYKGQPTQSEIVRAAEVVSRNYGDLPEDEWRKRVKNEVGDNSFTYVGVSTTLYLPGIDAGFSWDFADHKGSGWNFAVGITWGLNTMLVPIPYVAASYSF